MNTFKFDPVTMRPGPCGVCYQNPKKGDECCWLTSFKGIDPKTLQARFRSALGHVECARKEGYHPMDPNQPAWLIRRDLEVFNEARRRHSQNG